MNRIWFFIYNYFFHPLFIAFVKVASLFNGKIRKGLKERKRLFEELIINLTDLNRDKKTVWVHSASYGEFEQAKPIIEKLKEEIEINIVVTFFSPSGYDHSLHYPYADIISYLPMDTPRRIKYFLNLVRPSVALFMRYDIWPNVIWELKRRGIPSIIADATMRAKSNRHFPMIKNFHNTLYNSVTKILCVSEDDRKNFLRFNIPESKVQVVGDTRFDRVYWKSLVAAQKRLFREDFFKSKKVFVIGSCWPSDEEVIFPTVEKILKYDDEAMIIIAPHEPSLIRLEQIESWFLKKYSTIRFSLMNNYNNERIIIIDSIGILLTLYYYADVAYVGGSFKQGIHNVLEPATYGVPVLFGPKIENSQEAQKLAELKAGFVVKNKKQAYRILRTLFVRQEARERAGKIAMDFVRKNLGATNKIISEINKYIFSQEEK